ncbi:response regulator transcription factor [Paenibacillus hexagrammi]|uniref:Response regulator n=1 Tax=Paenibacillus hexagrammi TaxID=2908839 RepID=A0ABY3SPH9_9BACL|nr:response regulator [Paenibacillus sp. YPD9-1]UJF34996.1 response regulator [Paenibacillus sp. YPD9-1]
MYKVLLVDDERMILEGISSIVDWSSAGTELMGTARNGVEAYAFVCEHPPDIIISDIRMPGMNGLELVAKVKETHPQIRLMMLSGFDEFEYAKKAMQYGVKHYLLKPCNENTIVSALQEIVSELKQEESKEVFIQTMKESLQKVLPHVKAQFLKEFVMNKSYGARDWEYYSQLFGLQLNGKKVRFILIHLDGTFEYEHLFAVKNIAEDLLHEPLLSSTVGDQVLIVIEDAVHAELLHQQVRDIRKVFKQYYKMDATVAISEAGDIDESRRLYLQALDCLGHRFYLGEAGLITVRDVPEASEQRYERFVYDEDKILLHIRAGNWNEAKAELDLFFEQLVSSRMDIQTTKSYVLQAFISMARLCSEERMNEYMSQTVRFVQMETLQHCMTMLKEIAMEITDMNYERNRTKYSVIIQKVIEIVNEQLGNPELSLTWVAHQMLYMNSDYLGKLFKKETGEKFSNYVVTLRVHKAMDVIKTQDDVKIFELAEQLGFGDNPQYFSQVFKKIAGCAPTEYKKIRKLNITVF